MAKASTITLPESVVGSTRVAIPRALALVPAALAFVLYLLTCSPTVNFTDSGELAIVAWTGGIAHPPGYPLYTLLSILAIHIPVGDPAWRLNILSALTAALAVGLFYGLVTDTLAGMAAGRRSLVHTGPAIRPAATTRPGPQGKAPRATLGATPPQARGAGRTVPAKDRSRPTPTLEGSPASVLTEDGVPLVGWTAAGGGLAAAGLLAVSLTFWNWATQAKFYGLHYVFVVALLWIALRARRALAAEIASREPLTPRWPPAAWSPAIRLLHLLAFITGLALTNHFLTFLILPGVVALLVTPLAAIRETCRRLLRHAGTLLGAGLLPLLLYLYLPIRASMHPLIAWGLPDTWSDFWRQVTAQSYQGLFGASNLGTHLVDALVYAANQFGPWLGLVLLAPIGAGLLSLWRTDRGLLGASALTALVTLVVVLNYNIREIATYWVPLYMIVLWWAGLGIAQSLRWLRERLPVGSASTRDSVISLGGGAILPLLALLLNWGAAGHRDNYTAELFVRNEFKNLRPNALVLTNYWDLTSASFYLQHVLNERPDVILIDKNLLRQPFYLDYLERNYPQVVSQTGGAFTNYKALLRQWIDTGRTPALLPTAYLTVLNSFIDTNLGQRPVYTAFVVPASDQQEQHEVDGVLGKRRAQLVPDAFGYRIATGSDDHTAHDPQFDLRGITSQKVPLDQIEASVVALYPVFLQLVGGYLQNSAAPADQQVGTRLIGQAQELQWLLPFQDERPRLR